MGGIGSFICDFSFFFFFFFLSFIFFLSVFFFFVVVVFLLFFLRILHRHRFQKPSACVAGRVG